MPPDLQSGLFGDEPKQPQKQKAAKPQAKPPTATQTRFEQAGLLLSRPRPYHVIRLTKQDIVMWNDDLPTDGP